MSVFRFYSRIFLKTFLSFLVVTFWIVKNLSSLSSSFWWLFHHQHSSKWKIGLYSAVVRTELLMIHLQMHTECPFISLSLIAPFSLCLDWHFLLVFHLWFECFCCHINSTWLSPSLWWMVRDWWQMWFQWPPLHYNLFARYVTFVFFSFPSWWWLNLITVSWAFFLTSLASCYANCSIRLDSISQYTLSSSITRLEQMIDSSLYNKLVQ